MAGSDRRIRYTRQVLKDSLFDMMQDTPVEKITVKELCAAADINRATFYAHYDTLTALLEEIEVEKSKELFVTLSKRQMQETDTANVIDGVLKYLKEHPVMRDIFLNTRVTGKGLTLLLQGIEDDTAERLTRGGRVSLEQAHWIYLFLVNGFRELLRQWFADGMKDELLLKQTLTGLIETGLRGFGYNHEPPKKEN